MDLDQPPGGLAAAPAGGHAVAPEDNASILPDGPGDQNSGSDGLAMAAAGLDMASGASPFRRIEPWPRCQPAMATYRGSGANVQRQRQPTYRGKGRMVTLEANTCI